MYGDDNWKCARERGRHAVVGVVRPTHRAGPLTDQAEFAPGRFAHHLPPHIYVVTHNGSTWTSEACDAMVAGRTRIRMDRTVGGGKPCIVHRHRPSGVAMTWQR